MKKMFKQRPFEFTFRKAAPKIMNAAFLLGFMAPSWAQSQKTEIGSFSEFHSLLKEPASKTKSIRTSSGKLSMLKVNSVKKHGSMEEFIGKVPGKKISYAFFSSNGTEISGKVIVPGDKTAMRYFTENGKVYSEPEKIEDVICLDYKKMAAPKAALQTTASATAPTNSPVYKLQSLPGATAVVILDFDGHDATGSRWGDIIALPSNASEAAILTAWNSISEDYRQFDLNITTDEAVYQAAPVNRRNRCIFTPTNTAAPEYGGIGQIGTFTLGGEVVPSWVFVSNEDTFDGMGEVGAHEIGHTMGLSHDGRNNSDGTVEEYYTGNTFWCPIMGNVFGNKIGQWSKGEYRNANNKQDDISIIATNNGFGFRPDIQGNAIATAPSLVVDDNGAVLPSKNTGIISVQNDVDYFRFSTVNYGKVQFTVKPSPVNPDLDMVVNLLDASGNVLASSNPDKIDTCFVNELVPAGTYYLSIKGSGYLDALTNGYSDYGSTGAYTVTGLVTAYGALCETTGTILREFWLNIAGTDLGSLTSNPNFPFSPSGSSQLTSFEAPSNDGDNYGSRIRGYVCPPVSGNYTFWIAGDDQCELYVSPNDLPDNKLKIATVPDWTNPQEWTKYASQKSIAIPLVGGQKYYIEALQKEGAGGDNLAVGWTLPDGTQERPIPGNRLSPVKLNIPPTVTITSPLSGTVFNGLDPIFINASAFDADGSVIKVVFYNGSVKLGEDLSAPYSYNWYSVPAGACTLYAVVIDNLDATSTSTGVSLYVNSLPLLTITSPLQNTTFTGPNANITVTADASDVDGTVAKVEFMYNNGNPHGGTKFGEDLTPPYTATWTNAPLGNYAITVIATDINGGYSLKSVNISVVASPTNVPPVVSITSPLNGINYNGPAGIFIKADAADTDGSIAKVAFYNGSVKLGEDLTAPFEYNWYNVGGGNYILTAIATDNKGANTTSTGILVNVYQPLVVTITSPLPNTTFTGPNPSINVSANATDSDGTVLKVEFYYNAGNPRGGVKFGEDNTAPYTATWTNAPAGPYSISAIATDDKGRTTLDVVHVVVSNIAPTVSISSPVNGAILNPGTITITASAMDVDGSIQDIFFYNGTTLLGYKSVFSGSGTASFIWSSVPQGTYNLTAVADDNLGVRTTSAPVSVTVNNSTPTCNATGTILREYWANINGSDVASLTSNSNFPSNPTSSNQLTSFEAPVYLTDDYGTRVRGYVCPPVSGNYTFWIATDDDGELWLSTNDLPTNKVKIANVSGWTNHQEWNKFASQQSVSIPLVAGQKYYIEALQKEGYGGDNLSVGWELPDGTLERLIPGSRLSPWTDGAARTGVLEEAIGLFPNPATDKVYLTFPESFTEKAEIQIRNSMNTEIVKTFFAATGNAVEIDLISFPSGSYIITVITPASITNKKLIIIK